MQKKELINNKELIKALRDLEEEKGIKAETMFEAIEQALLVAYKRNYDIDEEENNLKVVMDRTTGESHIYMLKEVVKKVENDKTQISIDDARAIKSKLKIGDTAQIEIAPRNFGRIAAQTAKQVIIQKIREESREILYNEFTARKGEIITGIIQKAEGGAVILDIGRTEAIMPVKEQVPTEKYKVNDKIRVFILDCVKGLKGQTQVIVSRANPGFVKKLFELEIPEIDEGLIEIVNVSREAGSRSKIAVYSQDPNIDPVGSCVGPKGIRIQNVINELNGEKIDVIEFNSDVATYVSSALLPAKILAVDVRDEEKMVQVIVEDDQFSLAIGKGGQNVKLAARLINWKIDIKRESEFREMAMQQGLAQATKILEENADADYEFIAEPEDEINLDEEIQNGEYSGEEFEISEEDYKRLLAEQEEEK